MDSLTHILPSTAGINRIKALNTISDLMFNINAEKGLSYANEAKELADSLGCLEELAFAYRNIGYSNYRLGKNKEALINQKKSLGIFLQLDTPQKLSTIYGELGIVYTAIAKYDSAQYFVMKSIDMCRKNDIKDNLSRFLMSLGIIHYYTGDFDSSLEAYFKSLENCKSSGNNDIINTLYNNIGNIYIVLNHYDKALYYFRKFLDNSRVGGFHFMEGIALTNIGICYSKLGNLPKGLSTYFEALKIAEEIKDKEGIGILYNLIGAIYSEQGKYTLALDYELKALKIFRELNYQNELADVYEVIGIIYRNVGAFNKAIANLEKGIEIAQRLNLKSDLESLYNEMMLTYEKRENYKEALNYHKLYKTASDSLFLEKSFFKIAELEAKYRLEQNERENQILKKENDFQKEAISYQQNISILFALAFILSVALICFIVINMRRAKKIKIKQDEGYHKLELLNATKDKLFSILAHDLKNPFGTILNISDLLKKEHKSLSENDKQELLNNLNSSSNAVYRLLENLLLWARSQRGMLILNAANYSINDIVDGALKAYLHVARNKNVNIIKNNIDPALYIISDKVMMETIIGNIISNAIKFSSSGDDIIISANCSDGYAQIIIEDNGTGMTKETADSLFKIEKHVTLPGTNNEHGSGLGLLICKELIDKHKGEILVASELNKGTRFTIRLPINGKH